MKKAITLLIAGCFLLSCGSSKVVQQSRKTLKGYWNLDKISYSESGTYNVTLFDDATSECLVGSSWRFIPNNNFGNYEVQAGDCSTGTRYFVWSIPKGEEGDTQYDILLKPTNEKMKSETNKGYRLQLAYLSDSNLQFKQTLQVDGSPFTIIMDFTKLNK